eukprot:364003-Chlamydomonas_euryale.AAC.42
MPPAPQPKHDGGCMRIMSKLHAASAQWAVCCCIICIDSRLLPVVVLCACSGPAGVHGQGGNGAARAVRRPARSHLKLTCRPRAAQHRDALSGAAETLTREEGSCDKEDAG